MSDDLLTRLEAAIDAAGSLRRFAKAAEFSPTYISRVRLGREKPSPRLARVLGYDVVDRQYIARGPGRR